MIEYTIEGGHQLGEREELFYRNLGDCEKRTAKFKRNEPLAPCKCHRSPCLICQLIFLSTLRRIIKTMLDNRRETHFTIAIGHIYVLHVHKQLAV